MLVDPNHNQTQLGGYALSITDLHHRFISFAGGMPALAFNNAQLKRELEAIVRELAGVYPSSPAASMGNIPMPTYGLAYSAFVDDIKINMGPASAELSATITATIHPRDRLTELIREYTVESISPIIMILDYEQSTRTLFWREQGLSVPDMHGTWGADADSILATTTLPSPQKDSFINEIEIPSLFTTKNMFVSLLIALLPRYEVGQIAPWLTLLDPLRYDYGGDHILVTASRAQIAVGGCDPKSITVEPDPSFPYGQSIPAPTLSAKTVDLAVYLPKTRIIDFTAKVLEPAVLVSSGGGGFVKWNASGSFGLKRLTADITTGIKIGDKSLSVTGNIGVSATIDFVGAARAWIDGPSGLKVGLASASVLGTGDFNAEIKLYINLVAGFVYGDLIISKSELTSIDFDVHSPALPWPIDQVAGLILDRIAKNEIKKLTGQMTHLGRWDFMGIPLSYIDSIGAGEVVVPITEGLAGVAAYTAIGRKKVD